MKTTHPVTTDTLNILASQLAKKLHAQDILLLYGPLGSGKTTFVQMLARHVGVRDTLTSPTFTVYGIYPVSEHPEISEFIHADLYRLSSGDSTVQDLLGEARQGKRITAIEWADRLGSFTIPGAYMLTFAYGDSPTERVVTIEQQ